MVTGFYFSDDGVILQSEGKLTLSADARSSEGTFKVVGKKGIKITGTLTGTKLQ